MAALHPQEPKTDPSSLEEPHILDDSELVFILLGVDATKPATSNKASSVQDGAKREIAESIVANARQTIKAQIWDTAGQERYRAITSA